MPKKDERKRSEYYKEWYKKNKDRHNAKTKENHKKNKEKVVNRYGGKCSCCGENELDFLAIDHIDNNGNEHRKEVGSGTRFASWLKRNNYPEGYQVLCHNCNFSKFINGGTCIHKL